MPKYNIVDIETVYERKMLNASLAIPSTTNSYSICIEYMQKWFKDKFPKDYFKSEYLNGEHALNAFKNMDKTTQLKRVVPALAINTSMDFTFDRDKVDSLMNGIDMYVKRSKYEDSFYKDLAKDVYLGITMKIMLVNFTFKIKLNTRAQQVDLYDRIKMAFRIGYTQGQYASMDFHVPYDLMKQLATDSGFKLNSNGEITDIIQFLSFVNKNSLLPILYKLRCINGKNEFFIRFSDLYIHIATPDITLDDGERQSQIEDNFMIEMTAQVRFPAPKFYLYYSEKKHDNIIVKDQIEAISVYSTRLTGIDAVDEHGWNQYLTTDFFEDNLKEPLIIEFLEKFGEGTDLDDILKYTKSIGISPLVFLNIKIYNAGVPVEYDMDWDTFILKTKVPMTEAMSYIALYVDTNYISTVKINLENMYENRLI